jgi:hypothetical protein
MHQTARTIWGDEFLEIFHEAANAGRWFLDIGFQAIQGNVKSEYNRQWVLDHELRDYMQRAEIHTAVILERVAPYAYIDPREDL